MKYRFIILPLLMATAAIAQNKNADEVKQIIESKNYVFNARQANSQRGRVHQLTTEYDLTVNPDSVIAWLPYFGRAYTAPVNPSEGGIKFTSTDFTYTAKQGKRKSWDITIVPKDAQDIQNVYLSVSASGMATLQITNTNRDPISYSGYIEEGPARGRKGF